MSPFYRKCEQILGEIRAGIISLIQKYFAGDSTLGRYGEFRQHIGTISGASVSTLRAGLTGLSDKFALDGAIRIFSKPATAGFCIVAVEPNIKILKVYAYNTNAINTPPAVTVNTIAVPTIDQPIVVNYTTGVIDSYQSHFEVNGSFPTTTVIQAIHNVTDVAVVYIQPQTTSTPGVS